jgi:tripartite-type tricarboxylate transporter receptor subunit TctC
MKAVAAGLGLALAAQGAAAQGADVFPSKRITFVVPFAAGGSTDVVARLVASKLSTELGQPVIVENKPGASGNIAGEFVAKSNPDGYTLFVGTSTSIANISLFKSLPFDMVKDFTPVSQMVLTPLVLVTNPGFAPAKLSELVDYARKNPGKVNYGSGGSGTSQHIGGATFAHLAKVNMVHVPYKGAAPAMTDVISGQIQLMVAPLIDAMPHIKSNRVRVIGVTTPKEVPQLPGVPPIASVLPGYDVGTWNGIFAPSKTPPAVVEKLSAAIAKVMKDPEVRKSIVDQGSEPIGSTSAEFRKFIDNEVGVWKKLIEISGATAG